MNSVTIFFAGEIKKMLGLCALSKCFNVLFILHLSTSRQSEGLQGYLRSNTENHAEFVEHFHSVLNIPLMASFKVACVLQCIRNTLCYSVNFAVDSDDKDMFAICCRQTNIIFGTNLTEVTPITTTVLR